MHEIPFRPGLLPKLRWGNVGTTADWQDSIDTVNETQIFCFGTQS